MAISSGKHISAFVENLISEKHQVKPYGVDLTVAKISAIRTGGDIDFGGSERKEASFQDLDTVKRDAEDKYGWWALHEGEYVVEFNEKVRIPEGHMMILQPLPRTLKAGALHPTLIFLSGECINSILLRVSEAGFSVKENARISSIIGFKLSE